MSTADQFDVFLWALLALGLGAAVGLEREARGHEAGLRTNALVCCGAAIFGSMRARIGSAKAAVLPVPVWAWPSTSRPASSGGMVAAWMGEGDS